MDVHVGTIIAFVLGFTLLPARPRRAQRRQAPTGMSRFAVPAAVAVALVVSTVTAHAVLVNNNQTYAHQYLNRAQSALRERPGPYALMRTKLPLVVAPPFIAPFTDVPGIFSLDPESQASSTRPRTSGCPAPSGEVVDGSPRAPAMRSDRRPVSAHPCPARSSSATPPNAPA